jgi:3-oxoacyl-[acyl-carrier protein] reductase
LPGRYDLEGVRAILIGAAGGIGAAIAAELRRQGARLALWDRRPVAGNDAEPVHCLDIADPAAVEAATRATAAALGGIDAVVHAAGVLGPVAPAHEVSLADWREVFRINSDGVFLPLGEAVRHMLRQPGGPDGVRGRIVVLSSQQAKEGMSLGAPYSASKAAVLTLVKSMGKELAAEGILVNAITPTAIEAGMAQVITPERRADILRRIPMGRFGTAEEVARLAAWLVSRDCTFSTGAVFDLSGGRATY